MVLRSKQIRTAVDSAVGCLVDFLVWWYVIPAVVVVLYLVVVDPGFLGLAGVSGWLLLILVVPACVVLFTATFGHIRAKRAAMERELQEDEERTKGVRRSDDAEG